MNQAMFFNGWDRLGRVVVMTVLLYPVVVLILRSSGKRTLAKLSGFELVVMAALGSTFADTVLNENVSLAQGILVYVLLFLLQFLLSWLSSRSAAIRRLTHHEPTLLYRDGEMLPEALKAQRVTDEDVRAAVRANGHARLEDVQAVILESDGSLSVIERQDGTASALRPELGGDGNRG